MSKASLASLKALSPLLENFNAGSSRSALSRILRANGWTWSTYATSGQRILSLALRSRWDYPVFVRTRGDVPSFHESLSNVVGRWPDGRERTHAFRLLALVDLAHEQPAGRTLVAPLEQGPFLPCVLVEAGGEVPLSPVRAAALDAWVRRMGQAPDLRWVCGWTDVERLPSGLRAPSALHAFFRREFASPTSWGMAGWACVPLLSLEARATLASDLEKLAPAPAHPDWYACAEASGAYLRLLAAAPPVPRFRWNRSPVFHRALAGWNAGWRPPRPDEDEDGWSQLKKTSPELAIWLVSNLMDAALPSSRPARTVSRF